MTNEANAKARYLRISVRKLRPIINLVRGLKAEEAEQVLTLLPQKGAKLVLKTLKSGIANATNTKNLKKEELFISKIIANQGPAFDRIVPWSRGTAKPIKKHTSHLEIILAKIEKKKKTPLKRIKKVGKTLAITAKKAGQRIRKGKIEGANDGTKSRSKRVKAKN